MRGRPLIEAVINPDMDFYKDMETADIEKDLKAKVKAKSNELPSYKGVAKTTVTYEPLDHTVQDRLFKIEW